MLVKSCYGIIGAVAAFIDFLVDDGSGPVLLVQRVYTASMSPSFSWEPWLAINSGGHFYAEIAGDGAWAQLVVSGAVLEGQVDALPTTKPA